jgi:hypothetical protein
MNGGHPEVGAALPGAFRAPPGMHDAPMAAIPVGLDVIRMWGVRPGPRSRRYGSVGVSCMPARRTTASHRFRTASREGAKMMWGLYRAAAANASANT